MLKKKKKKRKWFSRGPLKHCGKIKENAGNGFLFHFQHFLYPFTNCLNFWVIFILSFANSFKLDNFEILTIVKTIAKH